MKRVLIITYYWPPSAGSGVQRWLKFSKYLPEFGWQPVIFTPENPDFALQDPSLEKEVDKHTEVLKFPIWEPYQLFRTLKKQQPKDTASILEYKDPGMLDQLAVWLRGNLLIPDPRLFWVKPSVSFLASICEQNNFEAIITTGPPHSMHLIGRNLKRKTGIPWLADFRDPWSNWEFLDTLKLSQFARKKHQKLESSVFEEADSLVTISPTFKNEMQGIGAKNVKVILNGFDTADIPETLSKPASQSSVLEIVYSGVIDGIRDPFPFLRALKTVFGESTGKVRLTFVGRVNESIKTLVAQDSWFKAHIALPGYVSHKTVFSFYEKAQLLLLILTNTKNAKGNIPGKLFEYMATGREILALGDPKGDSASIINSSGAGKVFAHQDEEGLVQFLRGFAKGENQGWTKSDIQNYSRKNITQQLALLLEGIAKT
ncbi:glycosyltransferase family 4 protein [Cyclobacterium amurskyense]|uniref:TPR/glycosyl transferase domain protein n=1 Tax=Cyclobacterium amurskyense TaxID=320787 RepID=A0A0H4P5Y1_9BACT|nr:glycosyltransferase family 4 protein [Cyclobacterium amurskyense]AKP49846.1 TPR/glycosyl transferase domain protein [Cyclobacterium amurskyense]